MTTPAHPGHVVFAEVGSPREKVLPVSEVPESVAFARVGDALVPVVRVVAEVVGDRRVLTSYGVDGQRLGATWQTRG